MLIYAPNVFGHETNDRTSGLWYRNQRFILLSYGCSPIDYIEGSISCKIVHNRASYNCVL
jgi:hypothetical protein